MPLVSHHQNYETGVSYSISGEVVVGSMKFPLEDRSIEDPQEALEVARTFHRVDNISYRILRTIRFERKDGYLSREPSVEEEITMERLEEIVKGEETLPVRKYPVYATNPRGVDEGD